jgi:hypothetical protein
VTCSSRWSDEASSRRSRRRVRRSASSLRPHLLDVATSRAQDQLVVLVEPGAAAREPALAPLREALEVGGEVV